MSISERRKEIKRRRHRRQKLAKLHKKLEATNPAERANVAKKVRALTPGAEQVLANWGVENV